MSTLSQFFSGGGGGGIKSIQTGYVDSATVVGSGEDRQYLDITIAAVDTSKCVVQFFGTAVPSSTGKKMLYFYDTSNYGFVVSPRLTSTTNLRLSCSDGWADYVTGRWYVVEYN